MRTTPRYLALPRTLRRLLGREREPGEELLSGPIRGELLGAEHLADRARSLARGQKLAQRPARRAGAPLLSRLNDTRRILADAHARLASAGANGTDPGPAGEWLLDNFHVIEEHLREVHESLPRGYYQELPELVSGSLAGYPRVYEVATTLISHTEARVDLGNVDLFVGAFQEIAPLTIGELWAIPAMLRLALLESVRRMTLRTVQRLEQIEAADMWGERVRAASMDERTDLGTVMRDFVTNTPPLTSHFVARFLQQVRPARGAFPALLVIEAWITEESMSAEQAAAQSTQRLAITQVVMANSITSLRAIGRMDWPTAVERQSRMDAVLREDPAGVYRGMTFATRDLYRHAVERIAKRTGLSEDDVARSAVRLANAGEAVPGDEARRRHIGYYLVDRGLPELERVTGFRPTVKESIRRWMVRHPDHVLVGGILAGTATAIAAVLLLAGADARAAWLAVIALALLPAAQIAVSTMNQLIAVVLPPGHLPKLELRSRAGIPPEYRTAVVIPTLFATVDDVQQALETLEARYLANREANLHFALLSDFVDANAETCDGDAALLEAAAEGIRALNARYGGARSDVFFLFHRPRRWNPNEGVWMGWERKRGKLAQFNQFIRGGAREAFTTVIGDVAPLEHVRYVITLDSDTVLPPDAAAELIGTIAHPLNRAVHDPVRGRVVRGYGILQPRVGVSLPSAHRSRFASIYSGHPGVDPYTTAVSDVYQDLYREGSYTGKGIYDVDAFEAATHGRFPENALLSHDLIEGSYARAGLASDITVYDDYPSHYLTFTRRKHRWIRGDWQLIGWLTPNVWGPGGREPNRLSILSRWKIFDNLRRSTVEIAQLAFILAGWLVLPGSPLRWTLLGLAAIATPWVLSILFATLRPPLDRSWRTYYASVGRDAVRSLQQFALAVVFLPHQAWVSADAIVRTLWRVGVSRRKLLEWQTASGVEQATLRSTGAAWRAMWPVAAGAGALLLGTAALALTGRLGAAAGDGGGLLLLLAMAPVALAWAASPAIAHALGGPTLRAQQRLAGADRRTLLRYALLHWRYFDRFVSEQTHWLAPDNFQEDPEPVVAARTSPTNIGLQLLVIVSAYDLGLLTRAEMTTRLENAFRSLERLRRFHGHFYNWYDLIDLRVLEPAYVSTVDSGNLAGHLIALRQACLAIAGQTSVADGREARALRVALQLADERLAALASTAEATRARQALVQARDQLRVARELLADAAAARAEGSALDVVTPVLLQARESVAAASLAPAAAAASVEWIDWSLDRVRAQLEPHEAGSDTAGRLEAIAERAYAYAREMDFRFLFDPERKLFSIGYDQSAHALDASYYDLLASEARLASFIAIAKDDVPVEHWFRLGRTLTHAGSRTALVSWSGSMFEYLMPRLVMRSFPRTLLDHSNAGAVQRQQAYGAARGVPWGVSESAYNLRDRHLTYQYRGFGVPDLGLKRGLSQDVVVAPYASALALMVAPYAALENLAVLEEAGALGPYGFRDAIDYSRPAPDEEYAIVGTYMAHHIGMSVVALANTLLPEIWPRRFHADPLVQAAELLLYERIPRRVMLQAPQATGRDELATRRRDVDQPAVREYQRTDTRQPHIALLGHLPYTLMLSHCGSSRSTYNGIEVTRWRADGTSDDTGQFCYIKDLTTGRTWSTAHQPMRAPADRYQALLATDRVAFLRTDGDIETRTEITVVPEDAAEVRRITITNNGDATREIELTSYSEVVLAPGDADRAHPAFSSLFVETEWHGWCSAITATRRPRSAGEARLWGVHVLATGRGCVGDVTCETDRARFLGRGRSVREPIALEQDGALSGTTGAVLDPVFSLRTRMRLAPGQSGVVVFTTLIASSREQAFELADRYDDPHTAQRALDLAWTSTQVELRELDITSADAARFQELAGHVLYPRPAFRAPGVDVGAHRGAQSLLWENGISGDLPIMVATIDAMEGLPTLRELLAAHHFWRRRGLSIDLVILNAHPPAYFQELNDEVLGAISATSGTGITDTPGGVHVRRRGLLSEKSLLMLEATAAVLVACDGRTLAQMLDSAKRAEPAAGEDEATIAGAAIREAASWLGLVKDDSAPRRSPQRRRALARARSAASAAHPASAEGPPLQFDNGLGGMDEHGDYIVRVQGDDVPPAPWTNVVANPNAGFIVTERGGGFTWTENSYFFRLTPWHNDPVRDPPGEVLYMRDDDSGTVWCPTPAPIASTLPYRVRHGAGSSSFEHERDGIATRLTLGMPAADPVKLSLLEVTNRGRTPRRISLTAYAEWTLGVLRERTRHQVRTRFDAQTGAIFASNEFDPQFAGRTAFLALSEPVTAHTADRREFLGRNGSADDPAALRMRTLSGATGATLDPCAALRCRLVLAPGETRTIVVLLGAAAGDGSSASGDSAAQQAIARYADPVKAESAMDRAIRDWSERLSVITVTTPEPAFDAMVNRWSLYQALACRMWARSALYQSSGAYGFRDQLQDVMAFVYAEPAVAREHILRAAARQFVEGDVQHWWHPHSGRGVRTRFSDDLVWLPYVVEHYVRVTGDASVLDEEVPFLEMRALAPGEHEVYDLPRVSTLRASVYDHCVRALQRACTTGEHGLPLIGTGDWNDGMNRVGAEGRGESVWLAWFLIATLRRFSTLAHARGDSAAYREVLLRADAYAEAVETHGWDGNWYRRAYFDDGTPLGTASAEECRIDAIAQSWSVISGAGTAERQAQAMAAVEEHLVRNDARLIQLLTPPFDKAPLDPGYIRGYLPGVRENGAQYTHAALWTALASALTGDGDRAFELFQMLNPLTHMRTRQDLQTYKVEPYAIAADVYTAEGHLGRGGWTWYTGSASWFYRVGLEAILGFAREGDTLRIDPCVPTGWTDYTIEYRFGSSTYAIRVENPTAVSLAPARVELDGSTLANPLIPLVDDGERHEVLVRPPPSGP